MTNHNSPDELRSLWQNQQPRGCQMSFDQLNQGLQQLHKTLQRRKLLGYFICLFEIATFTLFFFLFRSWMERTGACLTIVGLTFMMGQIWLNQRDARTYSATATTLGLSDPVLFYRAELERQRDFHRGKWFWSRLAVFTPGPVLFTVGAAIAHPEQATEFLCICAILLFLTATAIPLNWRQSRKYQRQISALDALRQTPK
ncbi:MAG: hypothetical protein WAN35_07915 [Terracidiphilus sp.]